MEKCFENINKEVVELKENLTKRMETIENMNQLLNLNDLPIPKYDEKIRKIVHTNKCVVKTLLAIK